MWRSKVVSEYEYISRRKYGFMSFMGDIIMTMVTGGLWLIWIFVREMRTR